MIANELIRYTGNGSPRNFEGVHAVYLMDEKRNKDTAPLIYLFFFFFFFVNIAVALVICVNRRSGESNVIHINKHIWRGKSRLYEDSD